MAGSVTDIERDGEKKGSEAMDHSQRRARKISLAGVCVPSPPLLGTSGRRSESYPILPDPFTHFPNTLFFPGSA
jgi:hypothetical protein